MKALLIIMTLVLNFSCGDIQTSSIPILKKRSDFVTLELREKYRNLQILEQHFSLREMAVKRIVLKSLKLELEHNYPQLLKIDHRINNNTVTEMRKDPAFLSLELTIEHLAHREAVKLRSSRSASLTRL
jgi:hypothetical protein